MSKQLVVVAGPDQGRAFPLLEENLLVGRSRATSTRLSDPHVSRIHCQVHLENGRVIVSDFESAGGTYVNGQRITAPYALRPGEVIQVGRTQLRLQSDDPVDQSTVVPSDLTPRAPVLRGADRLAALTGQTLSHYEVGAVLAQGHSGLVFHARDTRSDVPVALKVLWPDFAQDEQHRQRFVRAMKTMLPLRHPNLVAIHGAGLTGGYCWIAMEYVEGESLTQVIQRIGTAGMLDWRHGLRVALQIGRALDYAHGQHIIHRNVSPMNILVSSGTKVAKLGDLMLAKALEGTQAVDVTRPGQMLGDVRYMSPERTRCAPDADGRSDIYGLGATVYALLTGRPPFEGDSVPDTILKIRQQEPVPPKKYQLAVPDMFQDVVLQMLAKRPEDRFQTARDLVTRLEQVATYQGVTV